MTRTTCSFCHALCVIVPGVENYCGVCRHRSDVPRSSCMCAQCWPVMAVPADVPPVPELPPELLPVPDHIAGEVVADVKSIDRPPAVGSFNELISRCIPSLPATIEGVVSSNLSAQWTVDAQGALLLVMDKQRQECVLQVRITGVELVRMFDSMRAHHELKAWIQAYGTDARAPVSATVSPVT